MARRGSVIVYVRRDDSRGGAPLVPASWDVIEESNRWSTIYPLGRDRPDVFFHAHIGALHPTLARAVYVCVGAPAVLAHLTDLITANALAWTFTWSSLVNLRADQSPTAVALRSYWIDNRRLDENGQGIGEIVCLPGRVAGYQDDDGEG